MAHDPRFLTGAPAAPSPGRGRRNRPLDPRGKLVWMAGLLVASGASACGSAFGPGSSSGGGGASASSATGLGGAEGGPTTGSAGGAGAGSGGADGGDGGDGGDPGCHNQAGEVIISDACGVFVEPANGLPGGDGTMASPARDLAQAVALSLTHKRRVFACNRQFDAQLDAPAGLELHGGLDCATDWHRTATPTVLKAPASPAILLRQGTGTFLSDVLAIAPDGPKPGASSIALIADRVAATLVRCQLNAGRGAAGDPGPPPMPNFPPQTKSLPGNAACGSSVNPGAQTVVGTCGNPFSQGGGGGFGGTSAGGPGAQGTSSAMFPPNTGLGGAGEGASKCGAGAPGAPGLDGMPGPGGTEPGAISVLLGYQGDPGKSGADGVPGQGGGGGGGSKTGTVCLMNGGASGGSGGVGGCGGPGGRGGQAGGSSIGLLSVTSTFTLTAITINASNGGEGGAGALGGLGEPGAFGGAGGTSAGALQGSPGCAGGAGGLGGRGGPGGGGHGGHSLGIAYKGPQPMPDGSSNVNVAMGGAGGPGGAAVLDQGVSGFGSTALGFN